MKQQQRLALPCPRKAKEFLIASPTREIRLCHLLELQCKRDLGFIAWEYRQKAANLQSYRAAYRTTRARVLGCFFELYRTVSPHRLNLRHSSRHINVPRKYPRGVWLAFGKHDVLRSAKQHPGCLSGSGATGGNWWQTGALPPLNEAKRRGCFDREELVYHSILYSSTGAHLAESWALQHWTLTVQVTAKMDRKL